MKRQHKGFTLVEIMIVVVIIGILAAIAIPSYNEFVGKSRRTMAKSALQDLSQFMERYYTQNGRYTQDAGGTVLVVLTANINAEAGQFYDFSFVAANTNAQAFQLQAVPKNSQSGDKCGTFLLSNTGVKSLSGNSGGMTQATCW